MTQPAIGDVVAVALGLGLATLAFRLGFAELRGRASMPAGLHRALAWVPVAALAAIVAPALAPASGSPPIGAVLLAALVAGAIAYRTRNLLASVGLGMAVYWLIPA